MSHRLKQNASLLQAMTSVKPHLRVHILEKCSNEVIKCLAECALNILKDNIKLNSQQLKNLQRYKQAVRKLADKKLSLKEKRRLLQQKSGSTALVILTPIVELLSELLK